MIQSTPLADNTSMVFLFMFCYITVCPMAPRFIINIRELYDRDLRGRFQGIDTGFAIFSQTIVSQNAAVSAIAFADVAPGQDSVVEREAGESEGIQLEALGDGMGRV